MDSNNDHSLVNAAAPRVEQTEAASSAVASVADRDAISKVEQLAPLACFSCKRRKIKCNRTLPKCSLCVRLNGDCEYPTHAHKPGPKPGVPQARKRRRPDAASTQYGSPDDSAGENNGSQEGQRDGVSPSSSTSPDFSQIMYPTHDNHDRPHSPPSTGRISSARKDIHPNGLTIETVCQGLKIERAIYDHLMTEYFASFTTFSIFRPGSIESKLSSMRSLAEGEALIAAIFAFSARFDSPEKPKTCPQPDYFLTIATTQLERAFDLYGDLIPPLWILQTCILVAFHQLTRGVRSRSWRTLGTCIRIAYEMNLHLVDANHDSSTAVDVTAWSKAEERRRVWWAIWELDVFASTIRKLPTAIDWSQNFTMLPVHDNAWFNDVQQPSCFLQHNPELRWKDLDASRNNSPRAWFIVINSLMRNVQLVVYCPRRSSRPTTSRQSDLTILANCLYCTSLAMPQELHYHNQFLDFKTKWTEQDLNIRQYHCDIYSIHLMTQLCRFMIYHHQIADHAPWITNTNPASSVSNSNTQSSWHSYLNASDEIVAIIRNSSNDHYMSVCPFLMNTIWFGAASQCAAKVFGPDTFDKRLLDSNLQLLRLTISRFIAFWGTAETLKAKLTRMEAGLSRLAGTDSKLHRKASHTSSSSLANDAAHSHIHSHSTFESPQPAMVAMSNRVSGDVPASTSAPYFGNSNYEYMNGFSGLAEMDMASSIYNEMGGGTGGFDVFPYRLDEILIPSMSYADA